MCHCITMKRMYHYEKDGFFLSSQNLLKMSTDLSKLQKAMKTSIGPSSSAPHSLSTLPQVRVFWKTTHCLGHVVLSYFTQYQEKKVKNFNYIYSVPLHLFFQRFKQTGTRIQSLSFIIDLLCQINEECNSLEHRKRRQF